MTIKVKVTKALSKVTVLKQQWMNCAFNVVVYIWVDELLNPQNAMSSFGRSREDF